MAESGHTLLLVDDEEDNLFLLKRTLERDYPVVAVKSAEEALEVFARERVDLVLADNRLPGMSGIQLCAEIADRWPDTMRILVTGYTEVQDLLGAINEGQVYQYVTKPWDAPHLKLVLRRALEALDLQQETKQLVSRLWENFARLKANYLKSLVSLVGAIESHDPFMVGHSGRVRDLAVALARESGVPEDEIKHLEWGALLHDLGTHWVSADILRKPARLDDEELRQVRRHPPLGAGLLEFSYAFDEVQEIILSHHERWDGTGYPAGLKGDGIPLLARVVAVVETYDALTSTRPHRPAFPDLEAREILERSGGGHLDPLLVEHFLGLLASPAFNKDLKQDPSPAGG
jgi:response regulator RpfG family c-di-GMP phosphodiesterase